MPCKKNPMTDRDFEQELARLRLKIDLLPEAQRPHLYELAETIARQHRTPKNRESRNHEVE
jgi:hypothetical protein